ncbi:MAG: helix-turn-helix domain-containing protein [Caulobacter sp.]|nr:helix-turn-helix domain-containing protein [Caulobacter sp.]
MTDDALRSPNPIDIHVGRRVRQRRKAMGVTQERLAHDLGLTFQQVQKYERGANRVSASKLYEIAVALQTSTAYFFEGLADPAQVKEGGAGDPASEKFINAFLMSPEGLELAEMFSRLQNARLRKRIVDLVRSMVEDEES